MKKLFLIVFSLVLILAAGCFLTEPDASGEDVFDTQIIQLGGTSYDELNHEEIRQAIFDGVKWFKNAQSNDGNFKYEYAPFLDRYIDDDNIVRQAGALYELGEVFVRDPEKKLNLTSVLVNAVSYFEEISEDGKYLGYDFRCIPNDSKRCSLGAVSLALIGVLDLVEGEPQLKDDYEELIEDYANYILAMKNEGKGFKKYYYLREDQSDTESPFFNGEAFLALVRYYKYNSSDEVMIVLDDAFEYFEDFYGENLDNNFYLWGMAAIKDMYLLQPDMRYVDFVKKYTDERISLYKFKRGSERNRCAYIEGVVSAYSVLKPNVTNEEQNYYEEEIGYWLSHSEDLQLKTGDTMTARLNGRKSQVLMIKDSGKAVGGFLTALNEPVQRIDFTQHCLSAFLQKLVDIDKEKL